MSPGRARRIAVVVALPLALACSQSHRSEPGPPVPALPAPVAPTPTSRNDAPAPATRPEPTSTPAANATGAPEPAATSDAGTPQPSATTDAGAPALPIDAGARVSYGKLQVEVLTKPSPDARYQPRNLLAIWVEDEAATPLRVLLWGAGARYVALQAYLEHVVDARARAGDAGIPIGPTMLFGFIPDRQWNPDVVTTATLARHEQRVATWDMTVGSERTPAPDGRYTLLIESADELNHPGALAVVPFTKGPEPFAIELPEDEGFGPISVRYTPPPRE